MSGQQKAPKINVEFSVAELYRLWKLIIIPSEKFCEKTFGYERNYYFQNQLADHPNVRESMRNVIEDALLNAEIPVRSLEGAPPGLYEVHYSSRHPARSSRPRAIRESPRKNFVAVICEDSAILVGENSTPLDISERLHWFTIVRKLKYVTGVRED